MNQVYTLPKKIHLRWTRANTSVDQLLHHMDLDTEDNLWKLAAIEQVLEIVFLITLKLIE
jgi:hypothetical protein